MQFPRWTLTLSPQEFTRAKTIAGSTTIKIDKKRLEFINLLSKRAKCEPHQKNGPMDLSLMDWIAHQINSGYANNCKARKISVTSSFANVVTLFDLLETDSGMEIYIDDYSCGQYYFGFVQDLRFDDFK